MLSYKIDNRDKHQENYEYSDAMMSLILAYYMNDDSDLALRKTARRVRKRLKSKPIKNIMTFISESKNTTEYLNKRFEMIQEHYSMEDFLAAGYMYAPE